MNVLRNNRGLTLAELVVASAIAVILAGFASIAFSMGMDVFVRTSRLMEAETEMMRAMFAIKSTFSQSVNIVYGGDTAAAMTSGNPNAYNTRDQAAATAPRDVTLGKLFTPTFNTTTASATPTTYLIAMGLKEMNTGKAIGGTEAPNSRFFGTGVYFLRPSFTSSGALYIDQENNSGTAPGGWVQVSPVNSTNYYSRLTEFYVYNVNVINADKSVSVAGTFDEHTSPYVNDFTDSAAQRLAYTGKVVSSADFRLVMRYFTLGAVNDWRWCPDHFMPGNTTGGAVTGGCQNNAKNAHYVDFQKKITVVFSNNAYDRDKYLSERPHGNIYFFKSWAPMTDKAGL